MNETVIKQCLMLLLIGEIERLKATKFMLERGCTFNDLYNEVTGAFYIADITTRLLTIEKLVHDLRGDQVVDCPSCGHELLECEDMLGYPYHRCINDECEYYEGA